MATPKRKYTDPKVMQAKVDAYFEACDGEPERDEDGFLLTDKWGNFKYRTKPKPYTISGLALALDFTDPKMLYDYQKRPKFREVIQRARLRIQNYTEERLFDKEGQNGARFSLANNYGWTSADKESGSAAVNIIVDIPRPMRQEGSAEEKEPDAGQTGADPNGG